MSRGCLAELFLSQQIHRQPIEQQPGTSLDLLVILNQFLPTASQVLLSLISSKSARCGLGLGVVGVEVAEQEQEQLGTGGVWPSPSPQRTCRVAELKFKPVSIFPWNISMSAGHKSPI